MSGNEHPYQYADDGDMDKYFDPDWLAQPGEHRPPPLQTGAYHYAQAPAIAPHPPHRPELPEGIQSAPTYFSPNQANPFQAQARSTFPSSTYPSSTHPFIPDHSSLSAGQHYSQQYTGFAPLSPQSSQHPFHIPPPVYPNQAHPSQYLLSPQDALERQVPGLSPNPVRHSRSRSRSGGSVVGHVRVTKNPASARLGESSQRRGGGGEGGRPTQRGSRGHQWSNSTSGYFGRPPTKEDFEEKLEATRKELESHKTRLERQRVTLPLQEAEMNVKMSDPEADPKVVKRARQRFRDTKSRIGETEYKIKICEEDIKQATAKLKALEQHPAR